MLTFRQKLEKCRKSLMAHVDRSNTPKGRRSVELIDHYQGLRSQIVGDDTTSKEWAAYCQGHGFDFRHDAGDFFA